MTLNEFLSHLDGVRYNGTGDYTAKCPGPLHEHGDKHPSLSVTDGTKGVLLHCYAGCTAADICEDIGLSLGDLFYEQRATPRNTIPPIDVLRILQQETTILGIAAGDMLAGKPFTDDDLRLIQQASARVLKLTSAYL